MTKRLMIVLAIMAATVCHCLAQNSIVRMMPENGTTVVNIDTHLTLTMSDETTVGQIGFVSVCDKQTGRLVDRLDMSIPAGPKEGQPKNPMMRQLDPIHDAELIGRYSDSRWVLGWQ